MALSEADRADLYTGFVEVFGPQRAETMMSAFRLNDLDEIATKRDLAELRTEFAEHRSEWSIGLAGLRGEVAGLRSEMTSMKAELKAEFKSDSLRLSYILIAGFLAVIAGMGLFG